MHCSDFRRGQWSVYLILDGVLGALTLFFYSFFYPLIGSDKGVRQAKGK